MITAIDTNILLDVFGADPTYLENSQTALRKCLAEGSVIACEVVWAETAAFFPTVESALQTMDRLGLIYSEISKEVSLQASVAWRKYRKRGGTRLRILPDFLIGAHATACADRLLTRDSRFHRSFFSGLTVIDPSTIKR